MNLNDLRNKIDSIDDEMIKLLAERMEVVKAVGELKKTTNAIIYRPERELDIINRLDRLSQGSLLPRSAVEAIFLEIFAVSRNLELPERIGFWGPEGSFTHQAAESRFGAMSEYIALPSVKSVFEGVSTERIRFGVVPIENNQEGPITETIDMLCEHGVKIVAEIPMPIHFTLASVENDIKNIKTIYSKARTFRQCRNFIDDYFGSNVAKVEVESMPDAALKAVNEEGTAAICSHIAAKLHKLPTLFENIEDSDNNFTRFLIIGKNFINQKGQKDKTSILAKLDDKPGALARFLIEFESNGINLTKVESRPAKEGSSFKYWFLIDFDGHFKDENVQKILNKYQEQITLMGSYVKLC